MARRTITKACRCPADVGHHQSPTFPRRQSRGKSSGSGVVPPFSENAIIPGWNAFLVATTIKRNRPGDASNPTNATPPITRGVIDATLAVCHARWRPYKKAAPFAPARWFAGGVWLESWAGAQLFPVLVTERGEARSTPRLCGCFAGGGHVPSACVSCPGGRS